jgi:hypothetical protein
MRSSPSPAPEYDARISIVATRPLVRAVATAAYRREQSINAYVRGALLDSLARDGVTVKEMEPA